MYILYGARGTNVGSRYKRYTVNGYMFTTPYTRVPANEISSN